MKKVLIIIFLLSGILNFAGCQPDNPEVSISARDFLNLEDSLESIIIDVRTDSEYQSGHVENAVLISLQSRDFKDKILKLNKDKTYYVYCRSGIRSRSAVMKMKKEGFAEVYNIKGGIIDLTRNGLTLVK